MPFIGNQLSTSFQNVETQTITGDGSTSYTLNNAVADGKDLLVYINNVKQEEGSGKSYTATGTTITFTEAVASTDSCYVVFIGQAIGTVTPKDGSIVSSMLADANLEMPNTLDLNGKEFFLDADADTSITADTDDTIDIKIAGTDNTHLIATGVGIGVSPTTSYGRVTQVHDTGTSGANLRLTDSTSGSGTGNGFEIIQIGVNNYMINREAGFVSIYTSGTEALKIDSSGHITKPLQPAFQVHPASTQSNFSGSDTVIAMGTERFDQNGDFASNTFTAPVTGKYFFSLNLYMDTVPSDASYIEPKIVTSNRTYYGNTFDPEAYDADPTYLAVSFSVLADLDASDTAVCKVTQAGGTAQADVSVASMFTGFLVA